MGNKSSSRQTTAVTTNTSVDTGDIGITGANTIDLLNTLTQSSAVVNQQSNELALTAFENIKDTYVQAFDRIGDITAITADRAIESSDNSEKFAKLGAFVVVGLAALQLLRS